MPLLERFVLPQRTSCSKTPSLRAAQWEHIDGLPSKEREQAIHTGIALETCVSLTKRHQASIVQSWGGRTHSASVSARCFPPAAHCTRFVALCGTCSLSQLFFIATMIKNKKYTLSSTIRYKWVVGRRQVESGGPRRGPVLVLLRELSWVKCRKLLLDGTLWPPKAASSGCPVP